MISFRQTSGCHYQWQQTRTGRWTGWCGHLTTIRTSYKENLTYPVITVCPAQRDRGICRSDFRPGETVYCICSTHLFTQRSGGLLKYSHPGPTFLQACSPSCLGQEAAVRLQADGALMLLQALEFGWVEMDRRVSSGINNPHPPRRRVPSSGTCLRLLAIPPEASPTAPSFSLAAGIDSPTTHQIDVRHMLGILITFSHLLPTTPCESHVIIPI